MREEITINGLGDVVTLGIQSAQRAEEKRRKLQGHGRRPRHGATRDFNFTIVHGSGDRTTTRQVTKLTEKIVVAEQKVTNTINCENSRKVIAQRAKAKRAARKAVS